MSQELNDGAVSPLRPGKLHRAIIRLTPLLLLSITACTTWVKPGAGPAELDRATTRCHAASYAIVESEYIETRSYGADYNRRDKCEKNSPEGCVRRGGKWYAVHSSTRDLNSNARDTVFRDCMYEGGWRMKQG